MDSRVYWIWMQQAVPPGSPSADELLRAFGSARAVYGAGTDELSACSFLSGTEQRALRDKSLDGPAALLKRALSGGDWLLTPEDALYPALLRLIEGVPLVLYGRGEMPDLNLLPAVAMVGTRRLTAYGREATARVAYGLARGGMLVVSGGALGGDGTAHEAALEAGGITIAVQGCGLDADYPRPHAELRRRIAKAGAVITEFPPGTPPEGRNFPLRNRLLSGMTLGTCVTEAPERSGALITARRAFEQGRDVFAVAGDMLSGRSPGTDGLIRQGGQLIRGCREILEEYFPRFPDILQLPPESAEDFGGLPPRFLRTPPDRETGGSSVKKDSAAKPCSAPETPGSRRGEKQEGAFYAKGQAAASDASASVNPTAEVSPAALSLWKLLSDTPRALGELMEVSGLNAPRALSALTELELSGAALSLPGQRYVRK